MSYLLDPTVLPIVFASLMGLSILAYSILDGYDLGVGMLMSQAAADERDRMIGSIGPFWDANETWLVLAVGLLLVAFPAAHGQILSALYLPTTIMLLALIFRGVAFEFRAKTGAEQKRQWDLAFSISSFIVPLAQGYMLGRYLMGLDASMWSHAFAVVVGIALTSGYVMMASGWLILKSEGPLQQKSLTWMRISLIASLAGMIFVSIITPLISDRIFDKWFTFPGLAWVAPLPIITIYVFWRLWKMTVSNISRGREWMPFALSALIFTLGFAGLAYSFFPYIIPEKLTILDGATSYESLIIMFYGTLCVLPLIICYTLFAYWLFSGKARPLTYT